MASDTSNINLWRNIRYILLLALEEKTMTAPTTAAQDAGYQGQGASENWAAAGQSLFSSIGLVLDSIQNKKVAWTQSYNANLRSASEVARIRQQNANNDQTAVFNLQQLANQAAGIQSQAGLDNSRTSSIATMRGQQGTGGVTSDQLNAGGTLNFLQAGLQLKANEARRKETLMRLAQGYQLPVPTQEYKYQTRWDELLKGVGQTASGVVQTYMTSQIGSLGAGPGNTGSGGAGNGGGP